MQQTFNTGIELPLTNQLLQCHWKLWS